MSVLVCSVSFPLAPLQRLHGVVATAGVQSAMLLLLQTYGCVWAARVFAAVLCFVCVSAPFIRVRLAAGVVSHVAMLAAACLPSWRRRCSSPPSSVRG